MNHFMNNTMIMMYIERDSDENSGDSQEDDYEINILSVENYNIVDDTQHNIIVIEENESAIELENTSELDNRKWKAYLKLQL
jgi:hypothetical protein